jgi:hypothetical protein
LATTELARIVNQEIFKPEGEYELSKLSLRKEIDPLVERAKGMVISDESDHQTVVDLGRVLTAAGKEVVETYEPFKKGIDSIKSQILADENYEKDRVKVAKELLQRISLTWTLEQNRKRAEKEKIERELALKAEEERKIQEAIALEAEGNTQEAEQVLSEETLPPPVIVQSAPKPKGQVIKTTYYAEITNKKELVQAIAAGTVPIEAIKEFNMSYLKKRLKS